MYFCFEIDGKRSVVPEHSLVGLDENGFTVQAVTGVRTSVNNWVFLRMSSYQGCVQNYAQALNWVKRLPNRPKE